MNINTKKIVFILFVIIALIQLYIPASMIIKRETTLKTGKVYKFEIAPVDPYDAFRGRYVALSVKENFVNMPTNLDIPEYKQVYATISINDKGFAYFSSIALKPPKNKNYIKTKLRHYSFSEKNVYLSVPFDRYYMEEHAAPKAEKIYRENSSGNKQDAYITVRVLNGFAVLEDLYIEDKPIMELLDNL